MEHKGMAVRCQWKGQGGLGCSKKGEARKETGWCFDKDTVGRGWQSRQIKLKELKHEGHIALGK
jgi:hypothetical protein